MAPGEKSVAGFAGGQNAETQDGSKKSIFFVAAVGGNSCMSHNTQNPKKRKARELQYSNIGLTDFQERHAWGSHLDPSGNFTENCWLP